MGINGFGEMGIKRFADDNIEEYNFMSLRAPNSSIGYFQYFIPRTLILCESQAFIENGVGDMNIFVHGKDKVFLG